MYNVVHVVQYGIKFYLTYLSMLLVSGSDDSGTVVDEDEETETETETESNTESEPTRRHRPGTRAANKSPRYQSKRQPPSQSNQPPPSHQPPQPQSSIPIPPPPSSHQSIAALSPQTERQSVPSHSQSKKLSVKRQSSVNIEGSSTASEQPSTSAAAASAASLQTTQNRVKNVEVHHKELMSSAAQPEPTMVPHPPNNGPKELHVVHEESDREMQFYKNGSGSEIRIESTSTSVTDSTSRDMTPRPLAYNGQGSSTEQSYAARQQSATVTAHQGHPVGQQYPELERQVPSRAAPQNMQNGTQPAHHPVPQPISQSVSHSVTQNIAHHTTTQNVTQNITPNTTHNIMQPSGQSSNQLAVSRDTYNNANIVILSEDVKPPVQEKITPVAMDVFTPHDPIHHTIGRYAH